MPLRRLRADDVVADVAGEGEEVEEARGSKMAGDGTAAGWDSIFNA